MEINKIDFRIEDLKIDINTLIENRLKKSYDFTRTFIWLAIKFINEKKIRVTAKELSKDLFQNYSYSFIMLSSFIELNLLKKIKTSQKKSYFCCIDENLFSKYFELAKSMINGRNKE